MEKTPKEYRQIKFRAWDKTSKQMNYKVLVGNTDTSDKNYTCNSVLVDGEWMNADDACIDLMQFTGLLDKNGKEIYEGDKVNAVFQKHAEPNLELIQQIVYDHTLCSFVLITHGTEPKTNFEDSYSYCPIYWAHTVEVIGNIHETHLN